MSIVKIAHRGRGGGRSSAPGQFKVKQGAAVRDIRGEVGKLTDKTVAETSTPSNRYVRTPRRATKTT